MSESHSKSKSKFHTLEVSPGQEVRLTLPEPYREGYWQISDDQGRTWKRLRVNKGAVLAFEASPEDNGLVYRAKVGHDQYSTPIKLKVKVCPKILQGPQDAQVSIGESVTFSVKAVDPSGCNLS